MFTYLQCLINKNSLRFPRYLVFHVTYRCNAACRFCFLAGELNRDLPDELALTEIEEISRQLGNLFWLTLGGGEPFLRDDLPQVCELFLRNNQVQKIAIPTNGSLPERTAETVEAILKSCPKHAEVTVGISLDGIGASHDALRKMKGGFERLIQTYERLQALRSRFPNFSLGILTTLSSLNLDAAREIGDYVWRRLDVDWHTYEVMRGETRELIRGLTAHEYAQILPYIVETTRRYSFGRGFRSRVIGAVKCYQPRVAMKTLLEKRQVLPCYAGRINAVLDAHGNVSVCELMPSVGNLRKVNFNFQKLWFSEKAEQQRASITSGSCYCTHCIFQNTSILFTPRVYPALAWEMLSIPKNAEDFDHSTTP